MRTKPHNSTPDEARMIAARACSVLAQIRAERNQRALKMTHDNWLSWADANHVCTGIRNYMLGAYRESLSGASPPTVRNPAGSDP